MIYWTLLAILCTDEGKVTPKMIDKLYVENGIEKEKINIDYTMNDVLEMLTEAYLTR